MKCVHTLKEIKLKNKVFIVKVQRIKKKEEENCSIVIEN